MSCQGRTVGKYRVITHRAVMGDMDIGHDPVAVTHTGVPLTMLGTGIDGHIFPDRIVVPNDQFAGLTMVFLVLRNLSDGRKTEKYGLRNRWSWRP